MAKKEKKLNFNEIKQSIEKHVKIVFGEDIRNFSITYAELEKKRWRINVEFKGREVLSILRSACFVLDAVTGEVIEFYKDRLWRF